MNYAYTGSSEEQWVIAPVSPGSNEFFILHKSTGYPLMIDGSTIKFNKSGITENTQRFKFKNINGDFFQIQCVKKLGELA